MFSQCSKYLIQEELEAVETEGDSEERVEEPAEGEIIERNQKGKRIGDDKGA